MYKAKPFFLLGRKKIKIACKMRIKFFNNLYLLMRNVHPFFFIVKTKKRGVFSCQMRTNFFQRQKKKQEFKKQKHFMIYYSF